MSVAFEALWEALAQYVENTEQIEEQLTDYERAKLDAARRMLEKFDAAVIATAG